MSKPNEIIYVNTNKKKIASHGTKKRVKSIIFVDGMRRIREFHMKKMPSWISTRCSVGNRNTCTSILHNRALKVLSILCSCSVFCSVFPTSVLCLYLSFFLSAAQCLRVWVLLLCDALETSRT